MSETMCCDECGKPGVRRFMKHCPEGWFYGESLIGDEEEVLVIAVCSERCASDFWKPGPGNLSTGIEVPGAHSKV